MTIRKTVIALLAASALGVTAGSAVADVIRVATDPTFAPMEFIENGVRTGFDTEIAEALAKEMGDEIEWIDIDFKGLIPAVQAGRADAAMSAIYITEDRAKVVDFTEPYYTGGLVAITKSDGPIKALSDLDGHKVSVQVGTKSVTYLKDNHPKVELVEVEKNQEMFNLVQIGRSDAAVTGKPAAARFAKSTDGALTVLSEQLTNENYGIAVSKNKPELTKELNAALEKLKADGTYQQIVEKWFGK